MSNSEAAIRGYLKNLTVLYVEDEEDAREMFTIFLKRIVGKLVVVDNGANGLEAYCLQHPRIIITDIQMPVMDGLVMASEIRKLDTGVQIIVLTAFEQTDYLKRSINIGIDKYLTKPVNGFELHEALLETANTLMDNDALQSAATIDLLTGLLNRRELTTRFRIERSRAERHDNLFALIIIDIDHFKQINDTHGHLAGDQVLKELARTLSTSLRAEDICGRWGGEEFLLILPKTDLATAAVVAEKLRATVEAKTIPWEGQMIRLTISLGVAPFRRGMNMEECLHPADEALYRAKSNGRNRHEIAYE